MSWSNNEVAISKELTRLASLNPSKTLRGDGRSKKDDYRFEYSFRGIAMRRVGGIRGVESNVSEMTETFCLPSQCSD